MRNRRSNLNKPPRSDKIGIIPASTGIYEGVARAALEIAKRQGEDLRRIQEALNAGDDETALALMRDFFVLHDGSMNEKHTRVQ